MGIVVGVFCVPIFVSALLSGDFFCESVQRVASYEGDVYILTVDNESNYREYKSEDMGLTWYGTRETPEQVDDPLRYPNPTPMPSMVCDPTQLQICYRLVTQSDDIEYSIDAGQTWEPVLVPLHLKSKPGCWKPNSTSIAFVHNESSLIIGMGTGGVVIRLENGEWVYHDIDSLYDNLGEP